MNRPRVWLKIGALAAALTGGSTALVVALRRRRHEEGGSEPAPRADERVDGDVWPI